MKLATLRTGARDGSLVVVSRDLSRMASAKSVVPTLQGALDDWGRCAPGLEALAVLLEADKLGSATPFDVTKLDAPLPRAYGWLDAAAYLSHLARARALRNAPMPPNVLTEPIIGERISSHFLGPVDPVRRFSPDVGLDLEAEVAVILGDVPAYPTREAATAAIRLITLVNDITYRTVLSEQVEAGRSGALWAKPFPTMAPVVVTPDELGEAWDGERVSLPLLSAINGEPLGAPEAGEGMQFSYPDLVVCSARTRPLMAGTVLAAGTVSNDDASVGVSCLAERRLLDLKFGREPTPWLAPGDVVRIEMRDRSGQTVFGAIEQRIEAFG